MQYMGGKQKISNDIAEIINKNMINHKKFVSLFCGACSVESKVKGDKLLNDSHEYLIAMWEGLKNDWIPDTTYTKEDYEYVKVNKDENKALTGFIGFACSFGGKWFGGYAKNKRGDNFARQGVNSLLNKMKGLCNSSTIFTNYDYRQVEIEDNSLVYCDPPYKGTTKYTTGSFNYEEYYDYIRKLSKDNLVICSEYNMPKDFVCVWEKNKKVTLEHNDNKDRVKIERLFIHESKMDSFIKQGVCVATK